MQHSYKQPVKNINREVIWEHAIRSLTSDREESRILQKSYVRRLWDYVFDEKLLHYGLVEKVDDSMLESWCKFAVTIYGHRLPSELRVAYLCGQEPENDLSVLLSLGVRIENIWAFESDKNIYNTALKKAHDSFPALKIYPGSINKYFEFCPVPFDIIYLDFTAPIFSRDKKPYQSIHALFDNQMLTEVSALIVTSSIPDPSDEALDFLTSYFYTQANIEGTVLGEKTDTDEPIDWLTDGPIIYGLEPPHLRKKILENFDAAYSAFATQYPILYANMVQPPYRILGIKSAKDRLFNQDEAIINEGLTKIKGSQDWIKSFLNGEINSDPSKGWGPGGDLIMNPEAYSTWHFVNALKEQPNNKMATAWFNEYNMKKSGFSRFDAVIMGDILRNVGEGYFPVLSKSLFDVLPAINNVHQGKLLFCDLPMSHLWTETALNQIGYPYHPKLNKQFRTKYCACERKMIVDVFVLDRCRAFYDWLPMIELYAQDLSNIERQMIARICVDAICKQRGQIVSQVYVAANLICFNERRWSDQAKLPPRVELANS